MSARVLLEGAVRIAVDFIANPFAIGGRILGRHGKLACEIIFGGAGFDALIVADAFQQPGSGRQFLKVELQADRGITTEIWADNSASVRVTTEDELFQISLSQTVSDLNEEFLKTNARPAHRGRTL